MASDSMPRKTYKLNPARVTFVYVMCVVGSLIVPLDSYLKDGVVESSELMNALMTFITGVCIVSIVIWRLRQTGKFLHHEIKD